MQVLVRKVCAGEVCVCWQDHCWRVRRSVEMPHGPVSIRSVLLSSAIDKQVQQAVSSRSFTKRMVFYITNFQSQEGLPEVAV